MRYIDELKTAYDSVDQSKLEVFFEAMSELTTDFLPTVFFGNGGSAAIANHAVTDLTKSTYETINAKCPCISLCTNTPLITAIANDYGYEHVFSKQLDYLDADKALVVAVSSSGNSKNILNGLRKANEKGYNTIAMVGFDGGRVVSDGLADTIIHVKSNDYGIVEDCHMAIIHELSRRIKLECSIDATKLQR